MTQSKPHWMSGVLKNSAPVLMQLTQATPPVEVWDTARLVSGLSIDQLTKTVAAYFKLSVADLQAADLRILKLVPERLARRYTVFPVQQDDRRLYVATSEPGNLQAEQALAFASSRTTVFQVADPKAILDAINRGYSTDSYKVPLQLDDRLFLQMTEALNPGTELTVELQPDATPVAPPITPPIIPKTDDSGEDTEEHSVPAVAMDQLHVLIVDDDAVTRRQAWSILAKQGYRVMEATDGVEALERVSEGTPVALIVLDLNMPRLDGRKVLAKLKSSPSTSRIPVIVVTSSAEDADEAELMEEGADDYIRKPLEPARFIARIKGVLRRAGG